jgi:hypothetical protein
MKWLKIHQIESIDKHGSDGQLHETCVENFFFKMIEIAP